jgi:hydroxymethylbilane synthase
VRGLDHAATRICVEAERAMNRRLHGSCQVPIAAHAIEHRGVLHLSGLVGDAANGELVRAEARGRREAPEALGNEVAALLVAAGAERLLAGA